MQNRLIIPLLCAASAVAFARGSAGHDEKLAESANVSNNKAALATSFTVDARGKVELQLRVRNNTSKMVELRFASGRTHDFVIKDAAGVEVWRWSKGRMFTQSLQNKLVKPREVAVFSNDWNAANMHGKFTAVALLASNNHPIEETVEFELK